MKKNIAIICLDKSMARSTAQLLADQLSMRFFDMRELFEFDHKIQPLTYLILNIQALFCLIQYIPL